MTLSGFRDTAPNFNRTNPSNGWRQNTPANSVDNLAKGRFVAALNQDELLSAFLDVAGFIGRIVE